MGRPGSVTKWEVPLGSLEWELPMGRPGSVRSVKWELPVGRPGSVTKWEVPLGSLEWELPI